MYFGRQWMSATFCVPLGIMEHRLSRFSLFGVGRVSPTTFSRLVRKAGFCGGWTTQPRHWRHTAHPKPAGLFSSKWTKSSIEVIDRYCLVNHIQVIDHPQTRAKMVSDMATKTAALAALFFSQERPWLICFCFCNFVFCFDIRA